METNQVQIYEKEVKLNNGSSVRLRFFISESGKYHISAQNQDKVVGQLRFEILRTFSSYDETPEKVEGIASRQPPKEIEFSPTALQLYSMKDGTLTIEGKSYRLKKSRLILTSIEVKDEDFFQVGLGSAMHDEMEKFAQENQCYEIHLSSFFPIGEFAHGSRAFYEHKGYVFENVDGVLSVYKPLAEKTVQTASTDFESFGTPLSLPQNPKTEEKVEEDFSFKNAGTPINPKFLKEGQGK